MSNWLDDERHELASLVSCVVLTAIRRMAFVCNEFMASLSLMFSFTRLAKALEHQRSILASTEQSRFRGARVFDGALYVSIPAHLSSRHLLRQSSLIAWKQFLSGIPLHPVSSCLCCEPGEFSARYRQRSYFVLSRCMIPHCRLAAVGSG